MNHTPTPWRADQFYIIGNEQIAEAVTIGDATFIVRACNAHDELVAALEAVTDELAAYECAYDTQELIDKARAALAKVAA